ncbi:MAG TPA: hypothetical protein VK601_10890 [Kofleriaceae bacterium]|nr:hypothetical protein [Kofleriaceae bacterium]
MSRIAWRLVALGVAALAVALAAGCTVSHRSDQFACKTQVDCSDGRICVDGLCAVPDMLSDGPRPPDALDCPPQCTSCNAAAHSCIIDCGLNGGCNGPVSCPSGWNCNVMCGTQNSCNNGVSCNGSTSCTITCSGRQSCKTVTCGSGVCNLSCSGTGSCGEDVLCGTGACKVNCSGMDSCNGGLRCGLSCGCDVTCRLGTCGNLVCKPGCNSSTPPGCSATTAGCNSC